MTSEQLGGFRTSEPQSPLSSAGSISLGLGCLGEFPTVRRSHLAMFAAGGRLAGGVDVHRALQPHSAGLMPQLGKSVVMPKGEVG